MTQVRRLATQYRSHITGAVLAGLCLVAAILLIHVLKPTAARDGAIIAFSLIGAAVLVLFVLRGEKQLRDQSPARPVSKFETRINNGRLRS